MNFKFLTLVVFGTVLLFSCYKEGKEYIKEVGKTNTSSYGSMNIRDFEKSALLIKNSSEKFSFENRMENISYFYKNNLDLLNKNLSLNLKFSADDLYLLENKNIFTVTYQEEIINRLKLEGKYGVYIEALEILEDLKKNHSIDWGCGLALASNFVASLSLTACVTGVGCPVAIAGKALAMAGVAASCL